jgi:hypothetical protein
MGTEERREEGEGGRDRERQRQKEREREGDSLQVLASSVELSCHFLNGSGIAQKKERVSLG